MDKLEAGFLSKKQMMYTFFRTKASRSTELRKHLMAADEDSQPPIALVLLLLNYFAENLELLFISYEVINYEIDWWFKYVLFRV